MRSNENPSFDAKTFVAQGYDRCGGRYSTARDTAPPPWLAGLSDRLPGRAAVLDIGCGSGLPVTRALAARFVVTGVDISAEQIKRARRNVPGARFLRGDIMQLPFAPESFAGVVMIYSLFHLPRDEHAPLFARIAGWLRPGGWLLATLAQTSHPGYVEEDFHGVRMYWSHFAEREYNPMLARAGFTVVARDRIGHGYIDADRDAESHPLVLARRSSDDIEYAAGT
jgi:SAM-dependent methyltransferase